MAVVDREEKTESEKPAEKPAGKPPKGSRWWDWFSHPLVLLLIGSLLSSFLIPYFTRGSQVHQMAMDTKNNLISQITEATSTAFSQLEVAESPALGGGNPGSTGARQKMGASYQTWATQGAVIGSDIKTYFADSRLPVHWDNLYGLMHNLYLLTITADPGSRQALVASLKGYFDFHKVNTGVNWHDLIPFTPTDPSYRRAWSTLEKNVRHVRDQLLAEVMDSSPQTF